MPRKKIALWKKIDAQQKKRAYEDNIIALGEMLSKDRVLEDQGLGPLPLNPRPLWEKFRKASNATDDAYVALVKAEEMGASESETQDLWDTYQRLGNVMWNTLDTYSEAMGADFLDAYARWLNPEGTKQKKAMDAAMGAVKKAMGAVKLKGVRQ